MYFVTWPKITHGYILKGQFIINRSILFVGDENFYTLTFG